MNEDEKKMIREAVTEMLKEARDDIAMAESYRKKAQTYLVAASVALRGAGYDYTPETLATLLAERKGLFMSSTYAQTVAEEIFGKEGADA